MFTPCKRSKDGMQSYCKSCFSARAAAYRAANPEKVKENQARSRANNPERIAERKRAYRAANPEKVKEARRISYAKNRESELAKALEYKAANKKSLAEKAREFLASNPANNRFYRSERRAVEKRAKPGWYDRGRAKELYVEATEFSELTGYEWHVDHIVPLKSALVCGLHWHGNMQVISASQNQSKSNRHWPDMPTET